MFIGYARARGRVENLTVQMEDLGRTGCAQAFTDLASGGNAPRPGLAAALAHLGPGDVLVIRKLNRIDRSPSQLRRLERELRNKRASLKSLYDKIDSIPDAIVTTEDNQRPTVHCQMVHFIVSLAGFERQTEG